MSLDVALPGGGVVTVGDYDEALDPAIVVHQNKARLRLIDYRQKPVIQAIQESFGPQFQALEAAFFEIMHSDWIDGAFGHSLRVLAKIVGQPAGSRTTPVLRMWVRARIRTNGSLGRPQDIIAIVDLVSDATWHFQEYWPASWDAHFDSVPDVPMKDLASILGAARAAGAWGSVVFGGYPLNLSLVGSYDEDEASTLQGGADNDLTVGGYGSHVYTA